MKLTALDGRLTDVHIHTIIGGPWNDSGDLQKTQSYIWVASAPGLYPYRCKYNQPQMQATLRVLS